MASEVHITVDEGPWEDLSYGVAEEETNKEYATELALLEIIEAGDLYMDIDDVKKAYDNVNLDLLSQDILNMDTLSPEEQNNALSIIDDWRNLNYDLGGGDICQRTRGIPQGSPASPMMFALYYSKCVYEAKKTVPKEIWDTVLLLTYADNNVIVGKEENVKTVKAAIDRQLTTRGLSFGTDPKTLSRNDKIGRAHV